MKKYTPTTIDRRVVILSLTGRLAGVHQIQGMESKLLAMMGEPTLPTFVETATEEGRSVSLVKASHRWVLYRENQPPGEEGDEVKGFNPAQK